MHIVKPDRFDGPAMQEACGHAALRPPPAMQATAELLTAGGKHAPRSVPENLESSERAVVSVPPPQRAIRACAVPMRLRDLTMCGADGPATLSCSDRPERGEDA
jgi:hypothetical protein